MRSTFTWATVTAISPLRIKLDGDTSALPFTPDSLVDPLRLAANSRVRCEISNNRALVLGVAGGPPLNPALAAARNRNRVINGDFRVDQLAHVSGTSLAALSYFMDRWQGVEASNAVTWAGDQYAGRVITAPAAKTIRTTLERADVEAGSFLLSWVGTATARIYKVGASAPALAASPITFTSDGAADVRVEFVGGTVSLVQLELAAGVPTSFERIHYSEELALCQRYLYAAGDTRAAYTQFNSGNTQTSTIFFPVSMRVAPTIAVYDAAGTVAKVSIAPAAGSAQNGITPPASVDITTDGWAYSAGGMTGSPGTTGGILLLSKYIASADF